LLRINNEIFYFEGGGISDAEVDPFFILFTICSPLVGQQVSYFIGGLLGDAAG
jgi:hypothetical protein